MIGQSSKPAARAPDSPSVRGFFLLSIMGSKKVKCLFRIIIIIRNFQMLPWFNLSANGYTFRGSYSVCSSFLSCLTWDQLVKKKIAHRGVNSFLQEQNPYWRGFVALGSKQDLTDVVSLCENWYEIRGVPMYLKMLSTGQCR